MLLTKSLLKTRGQSSQIFTGGAGRFTHHSVKAVGLVLQLLCASYYLKRIIMQNQTTKEIQQCSPELKFHINQLEKDSEWLERLFVNDPGEDVRIVHLLGHTIMMYLSSPIIYEGMNFNNRGEPLSAFYDELVLAMRYTVERFPNHFLYQSS